MIALSLLITEQLTADHLRIVFSGSSRTRVWSSGSECTSMVSGALRPSRVITASLGSCETAAKRGSLLGSVKLPAFQFVLPCDARMLGNCARDLRRSVSMSATASHCFPYVVSHDIGRPPTVSTARVMPG